eukprot:1857713-Rhodomonas_salina.1
MPGTDLAFGAISAYAVSGTDEAYGVVPGAENGTGGGQGGGRPVLSAPSMPKSNTKNRLCRTLCTRCAVSCI